MKGERTAECVRQGVDAHAPHLSAPPGGDAFGFGAESGVALGQPQATRFHEPRNEIVRLSAPSLADQ